MLTTDVRLLSARTPGLPPDLELAATLYLPHDICPAPVPGLIVGHGAGSHRLRHDTFCREACLRGFAVLALDFRGHGDSTGAADGPLEEDILAAARFLRRYPGIDDAHICYRGSSMGGFYGLKAASEARFTAMVLLCPAGETVMLAAIDDAETTTCDTELPSAAAESQTAASARWDVAALRAYFQRQDSRRLAARVGCPTLLVHVRDDPVVPLEHSLMLAAGLRGDATLLALATGTHTTAQHDPAVHALTASWLLAQIKTACTGRT